MLTVEQTIDITVSGSLKTEQLPSNGCHTTTIINAKDIIYLNIILFFFHSDN